VIAGVAVGHDKRPESSPRSAWAAVRERLGSMR
jgi:hypothetical protein